MISIMRKMKLLLALFVLFVGTTASWAQGWTSSEVGAGEFYLFNVGAKGFIAGANNWGTRASVDATGGIPVTLAGSGATYTLSTSPTYNGKYLGVDGFVDQGSVDWVFEAVEGENNVYKMKCGNKYLYADAVADASVSPKTTTLGADPGTSMAYWKLISKENLFTDFEAASETSPVWATCLIKNPGFGRNISSGWGWDVTANNKNMSGGTNENCCAEHWQSAFTVKQIITDIPNGKYALRVQAALTDYTGAYDGANYPVVYIKSGETESTSPFNNMDEGDRGTSMSTLSNSFSAGKYFTNYVVVTVTNGQIEIGVRGTRTNTWCIYDNFQLSYMGEDLSAYVEVYHNALNAANGVNQSAPMNSTVLSALQTAISDYSSVSETDKNALLAAANALSIATANANTSITNYAEAKAILDAANGYNDAGQASYTANEVIIAIKTAYDDRTLTAVTDEQKTAAKEALVIACKAQVQPADGCDMTVCIVNPSFETNDLSGWTNSGMQTQTNKAFGGTVGDIYCEAWQPNGTKSVSQTVTELPQGFYRLSANSLARGVTSAKLYAGDAETAITIGDAVNTYSVEFKCANKATFGFEGVGTGAGSSWLCVDNFQLTYVRQLTDEEIETFVKEEAVAAYNEALAAAEAIVDGSIPSAAYSNLQTAISNNTLNDGTSSEYNAAAAALNEAAAAAQALVAPYAAWKELKAQADALVAVSTNNTDKKAALASDINTQSTAAEAATTADAITAATSNLKETMVSYATTAQPTNDECFDLTFMIVNPHFKEGEGVTAVPTGWTLESGAITEHRLATHNFEAYHNQFNLSQTIEDLPKGTYKVTLQGFARHDNANVTDKTNLYCGIVNQKIKDIKDEYSTTSIFHSPMEGTYCPLWGSVEANYDVSYTLGDKTVYQPNGMTGSYYWFQEVNPMTNQPFYTTEVQTIIPTAGDLKIGFKCETNTDWVIWDNFHLYYYGSAIAVTIDEDQPISFSEEVENANITLKRTFNAGKWNTIALPFDLTDAETKEAFGSDAKVATFTEIPNNEGFNDSRVSFDIAADAAITANEPVLLKTSTEETTFTFKGKTIEAGEAKIEGVNFDFVGTYAASTTIAEKDYFISNDKLWRSTGNTTIKGTRAYLKGKTADARIAEFSIGESETTGISTIATQKADNAAYDMQGRRVETLKKGVYVVKGKKVVVK